MRFSAERRAPAVARRGAPDGAAAYGTATPISGAITGLASRPHQIAFNPGWGEMFVASVGPEHGFPGGVSRFTFDGSGNSSRHSSRSSGEPGSGANVTDGDFLEALAGAREDRDVQLRESGA